MKPNIIKHVAFIVIALSLVGCTNNKDICVADAYDRSITPDSTCQTKGYNMKNKIIVGSRQDDARVVYSVGKILKTWIAPYHQGGTLIAAHDNYIVVEKPHFLVGESVQREGTRPNGVVTPANHFPTVYRDYELDRSKKRNRFSNKNIKRFNNNIYRDTNAKNIPSKSRANKANTVYDSKISEFLGK
jgi:hypothetical protein